DYTSINPSYGTLADFKRFMREATKRGIRVISEVVINHTSDQHPWFQMARRAKPGSKYRDYYVWSDTPELYKEARIIFQDFEASNWTWDPVAECYYWHRFYYHQPDLNFDNPHVREAIKRIVSFWLKLGVSGLRLDAVPYLFERQGTNCENLSETHSFLKELRGYIDQNFEGRMLLAEANQWPEDAAKYFGEGDECHMAFHFPIMPRLFMSIHLEDSLPIIEIHGQTPKIPDNCQWALFLRNHDELTLEMVTDIERDYMFRVYAYDPQARINLGIRRRLAPLLKNDRRKVELMNSLLFSLTGTPVLYYGDEIGMGDNIYLGDRDGVRTPMQWSNDRNAGFSRANPQRLYLPPIIDPEYHYETVNVEAQQNNTNSLLWWTKQLIALRKRFRAFGHGTTQFLLHENRKVLVFIREYGEERIFIIANLSRYAQYVELDLSEYHGFHLVELFSGEKFPSIGELPYFLTLGPYGYYWFLMEEEVITNFSELLRKKGVSSKIPLLHLKKEEEKIFDHKSHKLLENYLEGYLLKKEWLEAEKEKAHAVHIIDHFILPKREFHLFLLEVVSPDGFRNKIPLVLSIARGDEAVYFLENQSYRVVARFHVAKSKEESLLVDRTEEKRIAELFDQLIRSNRKLKGEKGELAGIFLHRTKEKNPFAEMGGEKGGMRCEDDRVIFPLERGVLNLFTRIEQSIDLDVEMRTILFKKTSFRHFLPLLGYLEYRGSQLEAVVMAEEVASYPEEFNAWRLAVEDAERFLLRMEAKGGGIPETIMAPHMTLIDLAYGELHQEMHGALEGYVEVARLLGSCTAEFHAALATLSDDPAFAPVPFTLFHQRSIYQTMRRKIIHGFNYLRGIKERESKGRQEKIQKLLSYEESLFSYLHRLTTERLNGASLRLHGNFGLKNLAYTGKEFLITNFSPRTGISQARSRLKRSPLRDLARMLYSIYQAGYSAIFRIQARGQMTGQDREILQLWGRSWSLWIGSSFLRSYFRVNSREKYLSQNLKEIDFLLSLFLIERCMEHLTEIACTKTIDAELPVVLLLRWLPIYGVHGKD
ncbi:MAG: maltose alpha-D-glucosyltransferase, partial [Chlamydiia bacterium]|nr:maltose alpha-D-glucosyltransferase [Chlamydiia bacterium]